MRCSWHQMNTKYELDSWDGPRINRWLTIRFPTVGNKFRIAMFPAIIIIITNSRNARPWSAEDPGKKHQSIDWHWTFAGDLAPTNTEKQEKKTLWPKSEINALPIFFLLHLTLNRFSCFVADERNRAAPFDYDHFCFCAKCLGTWFGNWFYSFWKQVLDLLGWKRFKSSEFVHVV